jgi:hypothetical protein
MLKHFDILTEKSRGLLYRTAGDEFFQGDVKDPTAVLKFVGVEYYPSRPGSYADYNEMADAGRELYQKYPSINWVNKPGTINRSFAILTFDGPAPGQKTYFGKFFREIKNDMTGAWLNNELPGGWQLNKDSSLKASYYRLKPSDLFPNKSLFESPADIIESMKDNEKAQPLMPGLVQLLEKKLPVFEQQQQLLTAIRDDLGEIMAPIALVQGMISDSGANDARTTLLGERGKWSECLIEFPKGKTNGLVDSYLITRKGLKIGISSKGDAGATASIKNVTDGIHLAEDGDMTGILQEFAEQVEIIKDIGTIPVKQFPIKYGIKFGYINESQGNMILSMISQHIQNLDQLPRLSKNDRERFEELMGVRGGSTSNPKYNIGYHISASLAKLAVDEINNDPKFGRACLTFLNISPILQVHMHAKVQGQDVAVTGFTTKYPPKFTGTVELDESKVYYSTDQNGRCTFAYRGGGGDVSQPKAELVTEPRKVTKAVKPLRARREEPKVGIGREKR